MTVASFVVREALSCELGMVRKCSAEVRGQIARKISTGAGEKCNHTEYIDER